MVVVDKVNTRSPIEPRIELGGRAPAHVSAAGKALLAYQPAEEVDRVCSVGLRALTPKSITNPSALLEELRRVREQGVAFSLGELHGEVSSVAAPVFDHAGSCVAAISVSTAGHLFEGRSAELADAVRTAGAAVSARLGHHPEAKPGPA